MFTFNKFIKFFFIFINLILTLFLFYSFEANKIYIALFSFLINFYFYKSFNKSILSIHFFLSFFFWVGFWLKICFLNLENTFSLNLFKTIGKFNYDFFNPNNLGYVEESLIVAIIGISGFILSLVLNKFFYASKNYKKFNKNFVSLNTIYNSKKKTILSLFIISFAIVGIVNFNFSIYQRGIVADQNINLIVSSTFLPKSRSEGCRGALG